MTSSSPRKRSIRRRKKKQPGSQRRPDPAGGAAARLTRDAAVGYDEYDWCWSRFGFFSVFLQIDTADPPFPRNAGYWWFGCRAENKGGNNQEEVTALPSVLRPTWLEIKRDHGGNQNTDVGDLIMDAGENNIHTPRRRDAHGNNAASSGPYGERGDSDRRRVRA